MTKQFKEFIAPFPQQETIKMETPAYDPPGIFFPNPKIKRYKEGMVSIKVDLSNVFINENKSICVTDFEVLRNVRRYILQKHHTFLESKGRKAEEDLLNTLKNVNGIPNPDSLKKTVEGWKNLEGLISKEYFKAIEVDPTVLLCLLETDAEDYMQILSSRIVIDSFIVRYMACIYSRKEMPATDNEQEAINYIRVFQEKMRFRCCINITDVKTIYVELDDTLKYHYFYPEFRIEGDFFRFSDNNRKNATISIG